MRSTKAGFSLLELLIALTVFSIGILALAGTAGLVARILADSRRRTSVAQLAATRLETLRRTAGATAPTCAGLTGGMVAHPGAIIERWAVTGGGQTRTVIDSMTFATPLGDRALIVTTVIACL